MKINGDEDNPAIKRHDRGCSAPIRFYLINYLRVIVNIGRWPIHNCLFIVLEYLDISFTDGNMKLVCYM